MNINEIAETYNNGRAEGLTPNKAFQKIAGFLEKILHDDSMGAGDLFKTVTALIEPCCHKRKDAEAFESGIFKILASSGESMSHEAAECFEQIVQKFPNSSKLAAALGDVYGDLVNQGCNEYKDKLSRLTRENPSLVNVALQQAYSLQEGHAEKSRSEYESDIQALGSLYMEHRDKIDFAQTYAQGLVYLIQKQDKESADKTLSILRQVYKDNMGDRLVAARLSDGLRWNACKQDKNEVVKTIEEIKTIGEQYPGWSYFTTNMGFSIVEVCRHTPVGERGELLEKLHELEAEWKPAAGMAEELGKK